MKIREGMVIIDQRIVLDFLQFPNGRISKAALDDRNRLILCIEDEEMPEVEVGEQIPAVKPTFTSYEDCLGHKVAIRDKLRES